MNDAQYNKIIKYIDQLSDEEIREMFKDVILPDGLQTGDYIECKVNEHADSFHGIVKYIDGDNKVHMSDGLYEKSFILDKSKHNILNTVPKLEMHKWYKTEDFTIHQLKLLLLDVDTVCVNETANDTDFGCVEAVWFDDQGDLCIVVNDYEYIDFQVWSLKG